MLKATATSANSVTPLHQTIWDKIKTADECSRVVAAKAAGKIAGDSDNDIEAEDSSQRHKGSSTRAPMRPHWMHTARLNS